MKNPQAFPSVAPMTEIVAGIPTLFPTEQGMTLRDWFAGMALQGYIASYGGTDNVPTEKKAALLAYEYADAMLAEREKKL